MRRSEYEAMSVRTAFLARVARDRLEGRVLGLGDYVAAYPGFEDAIADEHARLGERGDPEATPGHRRYRPLGELGRGGMGAVLRVWDRELGRPCAMKILLGAADPATAARFHAEARFGARLAHPGIVPVHDAGQDEWGQPWFTMPLVDGLRFDDVIRRVHDRVDGWTLPRAVEALRQVCETVAYAHAQGVVHRDLKPANVMVGPYSEVLVLDWGLARRTADTPAGRGSGSIERDAIDPLATRRGDVVGTPAYMAPEQARGEIERIDPRSDVYALGAMLYHLLAGGAPYASEEGSSAAVLARVRAGPPAELPRASPPELAAVCERAMARSPGDRYADVRALAEDLRAYLDGRVVRAHRTGAWAELRKWVARNRLVAAAMAIAVGSLAVGFSIAVVQRERADAHAARAERNFRLAFDAVEDLLTEVGQTTLLDEPSTDPMRRRLLEKALAYYRTFLEARAEEATLREEVARAHVRVAIVQEELGDLPAAENALQRALHGIDALIERSPEDLGLLALRNVAVQWLANVWTETGRYDEALAAYQRVAGAAAELADRDPGAPEHRHRRAGALHNAAVVLFRLGRSDEALTMARSALEQSEALASDRPDDPEYQRGLANRLVALGMLQDRAKRPSEAARSLRRAVALYEDLLAADPRSRKLRQELSNACNNAGTVFGGRRSLDLLQRAAELRRELVAEHPDVPYYRHLLASTANNLARRYHRQGDFEQARTMAEEAIAQQHAAIRGMPNHAASLGKLKKHYARLKAALCALGRHEELAAAAEELLALQPDDGDAALIAAELLAACAELCRDDPELDQAERTASQQRYAARGVEYLRAAVRDGVTDEAQLAGDALRGLRGRADFAAVIAELRTAAR